jgi:hypothetical protein
VILQVKHFFRCIITGIWISVPFLEWVAKWSRWDIFSSVGSSVPAYSKPVTWNQNLGDHTNSWMWFFSNLVPTDLVKYWWQQMTVCQLLISLLWPVLTATDICSCSEFCVDIKLHCSLLSQYIWASEKFCHYSLHIYPYKNEVVEKFSEYSLCIFQMKIRLWSIHCLAEGIKNDVLTFHVEVVSVVCHYETGCYYVRKTIVVAWFLFILEETEQVREHCTAYHCLFVSKATSRGTVYWT